MLCKSSGGRAGGGDLGHGVSGVGLHSGYGAAQRMYVLRGYVPDGSGVWYEGRVWDQYAPCVNDDELNLFLSKKLF